MPRSPTSSEDETAQSVSDSSEETDSNSVKEEVACVAESTEAETQNSLDITVFISDLQQVKSLRFNVNVTVWEVKQHILSTLSQNLKDALNYGLLQPSNEGDNGLFLDEESLLRESLQTDGIPLLEFCYKKRLYEQASMDKNEIAKLHTKASQRKFMNQIHHSQLENISKILERGLDPNYHDPETGEAPLTFAAQLEDKVEIIKELNNGGAHLDFRAKDGMTALHKAARATNKISLKTLLELGASPNYKDSHGLTPLYHTVVLGGDTGCCQLLLQERSSICCRDENGWYEIHQACRHGHDQHLELLLFYGADTRAKNDSGNTALHICALYNQEKCAQILLIRGADKQAKNFSDQSPFQVAVISGNFELAELLRKHSESDVVPFHQTPTLSRQPRPQQKNNCTIPRLTLRQSSSEISLGTGNHEHLASRSLSPQHLESSARLKISARGTSANGRSNGPSSRRKLYTAVPGRHFIAIRSHLPQASGEIALQKNDRVKVLSIGEGGYWEGICRGQVGWFPSKCVEEIPIRLGKERPKSRIALNNRKKLFRHFTVGSNDSFDSSSDCVAEQKIVVLQKQDSEGFGFVLRGAKADTPIEEFTPTAAFPALQYLESVDEGGVAWLMGLRTGDFLIEINHQNVVKLGHRQVVNMIRMGGNRLVIKVVRVTRNLDPDNKSCKKAPPPPKRAATTALSMRSKTLTPELEESDLGEKFQSQKPVQEKLLVDKIGLIKRPPSSRLLNLNGNTAAPPVPARAHGGFFGLSKGSMKRQKSIGNPEEEKKFLIPPSLRFNRSLSMPDKSEDIPPPPGVSPPSPPYKQSATMTRVYEPNQSIYTQTLIGKGHTIHRDHAGYRHTSEQYDSRVLSATLPNGATIPENPYSEESMKALYVPAKPVRRKGVLVKQPNVEDSPDKTCSIQIPTIIVKEPSTSSSGKSSQGSSMEIDLPTSTSPSQLLFEGSPNSSNPFAAAIAGAVRDREKRLEARKSIPAFMSLDLGDEDPFISPPCLRQSVSIDEAMFGNADSLQKHMALPTTLLEFQTIARGSRIISDNPELAEHFNRQRVTSPCLSTLVGLPPVINTSLSVRAPQHKVNEGTHDTCLAARDNHVEQAQLFSKFDKGNPNQPLFINTKLPSNPEANFVVSSEASLSGDCQRRLKNSPDFVQSTVKTKEGIPEKMKNYLGQQTSEGLLMVHTLEKTKSNVNQSDGFKQVIINTNNPLNKPIDCKDKRVKNTVTVSHLPHLKSVSPRSSIIENVKVSFNIPPPLGSVDVDEEVDEEPLPPPLEFANSIDSVEDQKVQIPRRIKSCVTQANVSHYHSHVSKTDAGYKRLSGHGSYTSSHSYPPTLSEGFESVPQSERSGKRNNGESQFETNTTLSAVSSISTLSSVGIEDTFMVYSDGENILLEQPPVPPKPRMKPIINKSNAFCRNSLVEEIAESFGQLPPPPQECLEQSENHKALAYCGTTVCDDSIELPKPFGVNADPKANVINELSSKLQQLNKDRFPNQEESMAGAGLIDLRESDAEDFCTSPGPLLLPGSSPVSPPSGPNTGHSSSLPTAVTSPTLTDNFSLPTPPIVNPEQCCSPSSSQCQSPPPFMTYHPGRPVQLWTKYDVADWLESLNLAEHRKAFMENEIDGSHLPNLLKDDLVDLGVSRVGHRMNIERALKHLMDDGM